MNGYNFTDRTRRALHAARSAAASLHHEYVGPEHILLGLLDDPDAMATVILVRLGVAPTDLRATVRDLVKPGAAESPSPDELPYTSRSKKSLELAMVSAREIHDSYVGTQHLLLGLLREERSIATQTLAQAGVSYHQVVDTIRLVTSTDESRPADGATSDENPGSPVRRPPRPSGTAAEVMGTARLALFVASAALVLAVVALVLATR